MSLHKTLKPLWRYWLLHLWYDHGYAINPEGTTCILCGRFIEPLDPGMRRDIAILGGDPSL